MGGRPAPRNLIFMNYLSERSTDLLELELDWGGIHRCDCVRHVLTDAKGLLLRLPRKINEQGVCVTINNLRAPLLG